MSGNSPPSFQATSDTLYDLLPKHMFVDYWDDLSAKSKIVFFDVETTNLEKGTALNPQNELVLVCWQVQQNGKLRKHYHFGHEYEQQQFIKDISDADYVVAHNAKFDMQWLHRMGFDLRKLPIFCTMMAEWVLLSNRSRGLTDLSLNATAARYGLGVKENSVSILMKAGVCPSDMPKDWLLEYAQIDVDLCREVFWKQWAKVRELNLLHLVVNRSNTAACLADTEFAGMTLDPSLVFPEFERAQQELEASYEKLLALAPGVNFNSPKQVTKLLYDDLGFTPIKEKGEPVLSSNSKVMAKLVATTERQRAFLAAYKLYNKNDSLLSKNLVFFRKVCEEMGGKFYGSFNQGTTDTGRLSSSGRSLLFKEMKKAMSVQLQNIPRQYKKLFWAGDEEWLVGEADAAQLEFRVAAALGNDKVAIDEILNGADVHSITAEVLTKNGEPTTRQEAKASTFAPLAYSGLAA